MLKNKIFTLSCLLLMTFLNAQKKTELAHENSNNYTNPILGGDYPDPSILVDGENYYLVHSSFEYYPGLLIWQSKDLIHWTPKTHALNKYLGSVWAPDLVKCNNKYYIYFPANNNIYVVIANSIEGPWSDPINLKINNIDPGHIIDIYGKRYLYSANGGYVPLSKDGLSVVGDTKHVYDGWKIPKEWSIECFCMEGPKLVKHNDYYYLTVAEGGTAGPATGHMIISARSKTAIGPWENSPYNPILHTKNSKEKWLSKGHGTPFKDINGNWWLIYHAYEKDYYNLGRQTLLLPIEWTSDGWYKIPEDITDDMPIKISSSKTQTKQHVFTDSFAGNTLGIPWRFFGEYDINRYNLKDNSLRIKAKGTALGNSSPILFTPSNHSYEAEVELFIEGNAIGGLSLFYDQVTNSGLLATENNILTKIKGWQFITETNVINKHVFLRIKNIENTVDLFYSLDGANWKKIDNSLEISGFHHNALDGFLGVKIGLCSIGEGSVTYKNFKYTPLN